MPGWGEKPAPSAEPDKAADATPLVTFRPAHRWWDIAAVPLLAVAATLLLGAAVALVYALLHGLSFPELRAAFDRVRDATYVVYGSQIVLYFALAAAIAALLALRGYGLRETHFQPVRGRVVFAALVMGVVLAVLAMLLLSVLPEETQRQMIEQSDLLMPETVGEAALLLVIAVLLAPLVEELYFRGIVLRVLGARLPFAGAAAFTAVFFSLMHGHLFTMPDVAGWVLSGVIFVLGMVLAWLTRWSGSLRPAIAMHAAYNFVLFMPSIGAMLAAGVQT